MTKLIVTLFSLLLLSQFVSANETKIVDFKFKFFGPLEKRVYLRDSRKKANYGYYSIRPFISHSEDNYLFSGLAFGTCSMEDKTVEAYNGRGNHKDILNLTNLYFSKRALLAGTIVSGAVWFLGLNIGSIIVGTALLGRNAGNPNLFRSGVGVLGAAGASLISLAICLPLLIYRSVVFKKLKKELLNSINGIEVIGLNKKPLFNLKFEVGII